MSFEIVFDAFHAINRFGDALTERGINVNIEIEKDLPDILVHKERFLQLWQLIFTQCLTDLDQGDEFAIDACNAELPTLQPFDDLQTSCIRAVDLRIGGRS